MRPYRTSNDQQQRIDTANLIGRPQRIARNASAARLPIAPGYPPGQAHLEIYNYKLISVIYNYILKRAPIFDIYQVLVPFKPFLLHLLSLDRARQILRPRQRKQLC
jgi:hypothetical protein